MGCGNGTDQDVGGTPDEGDGNEDGGEIDGQLFFGQDVDHAEGEGEDDPEVHYSGSGSVGGGQGWR
jgi:hypothetical protein